MPIEVVYDDKPAAPPGGIEVVYDTAPPPPVAPPQEQGILDRVMSAMNVPGEMLRGAVGLPTPEATERSTENFLAPYLGKTGGALAGRLHGLVYGAATDPLSLIPVGALAKKGKAGIEAVKWLNRAFTGMQGYSTVQSAEQAVPLVKDAIAKGELTPEAGKAIVDVVAGGVGTALGYAGEKHLGRMGETPPAPTAPPVDLPAGDRAILERLAAASAADKAGGIRPELQGEPLLKKDVTTAGRAYGGVDDLVREILAKAPDAAPAPPAASLRDPNVVSGSELPAPRRGVTPEDIAAAPPEAPPAEFPPVEPEPEPPIEGAAPAPEAQPVAAPLLLPEGSRAMAGGRSGTARSPRPDRAALIEQQRALIEQLKREGTDMTAGNPAAGPEAGALIIPAGRDPLAIHGRSGLVQKAGNLLHQVVSASKAVRFSWDISAAGRQGRATLWEAPGKYLEAFKHQFDYWKDPKAYEARGQQIRAEMAELGMTPEGVKLGITIGGEERGLAAREDVFGSEWAEKHVPGVAASDRAYSGFLSEMRWEVFKKWIKPFLDNGMSFATHPEQFKAAAKAVNAMTGRGSLGEWQSAAKQLNTVFTSPRAIAASYQKFAMMLDRTVPDTVRARMLLNQLKGYSALLTLLGVAKSAGAKVETDPLNPDFGKARFGKVRMDFFGGDLQIIRTIAATIAGRRERLSGEQQPVTPLEPTLDYARNRLAPVPRTAVELGLPKNPAAQKEAAEDAWKNWVPLVGEAIPELAKVEPSIPRLITELAGEATGWAGVDVYGEPPALSEEDKTAYEDKYEAERATAEARRNAAIPPDTSKVKTPREKADTVKKGLKRELYKEKIMKALRAGDQTAAYRLQLEAADEDIDISVDDLIERLEGQKKDETGRESIRP